VVEQLAIEAHYEGYIRRQLAEIRRHRATETLPVPHGFDYWSLEGLTYEAKDKLTRLKPATLGQASRMPGVSPADISVLLVHLYRSLRSEGNGGDGSGPDASGVEATSAPPAYSSAADQDC
jgi:tRNA uridine 5-carboxymethylaminomethyl modification enzyme